jgi:hypothetical protein
LESSFKQIVIHICPHGFFVRHILFPYVHFKNLPAVYTYIVRVSKYSSFISPFPIIRSVSLYVILSSQSYPFTFLHRHPCGGYCFASMIQHIFADLYPLLLFVRPLLSEVALWESLLTNSFPPFFKKIVQYHPIRRY